MSACTAPIEGHDSGSRAEQACPTHGVAALRSSRVPAPAPSLRPFTRPSALSSVPTLEFSELSHVGSLDPACKKSFSHEGQGLSVSAHPDVWRSIARLGDAPIWRSARPVQLLDWHSVSPEQRAEIEGYALDSGWVERIRGFRVSYWDDEMDDTMSFVTTDEEERSDHADDEGFSAEPVDVLLFTDAFPDSTVRAGTVAYADLLATAWVDLERPGLDGVWWEDELDEYRYSAPRGVIVPGRVDRWVAGARSGVE